VTEEKDQVRVVIERRYDETIAGIVNTLQLVIVALALAFIVRTFFVEAFRIPTGSMAETLSGAHYHIRCDMCGFKYDLGHDSNIKPNAECPNCKRQDPDVAQMNPSNGDRIFVMKSIYQFMAPKRWDVVVFRNPLDPSENYIKRLIGKPFEKLELIGGDVYVDRVIQRKPRHVQDELWVQIYDSEYRPYIGYGGSLDEDGADGAFVWEVPFGNDENSEWQSDPTGSYGFKVDGEPGDIHTLVFDSSDGEKFRSFYAYNNSSRYSTAPWCSDFKIEFFADIPDDEVTRIGAVLGKYGRSYRGSVDGSGLMQIERFERGRFEELGRLKLSAAMHGKVQIKFANVDHLLIFEVDDQKLVFDLGKNPEAAGVRFSVLDPDADDEDDMIEVVPSISIVAMGKVGLSNISIFRDIHYIDGTKARRGKPFEIGEDEFFVCGDNSMDSFDSRLWESPGKGHNGKTYRKGIVPRDYLVGKAFFLYWGDAFKPFENALPLIPNFSQAKRIYGGVRATN